MSRANKIFLILQCGSGLSVKVDPNVLSDAELDEQVRAIVRRMRTDQSRVIARMVLRQPIFSLN